MPEFALFYLLLLITVEIMFFYEHMSKILFNQEVPKGMWFCTSDCHRINSSLQKLVIGGEQELPDSHLNSIRKKHNKDGAEDEGSVVKWRVLHGKMSSDDEIELLRSKVLAIFNVSSHWLVHQDIWDIFFFKMLIWIKLKSRTMINELASIPDKG